MYFIRNIACPTKIKIICRSNRNNFTYSNFAQAIIPIQMRLRMIADIQEYVTRWAIDAVCHKIHPRIELFDNPIFWSSKRKMILHINNELCILL